MGTKKISGTKVYLICDQRRERKDGKSPIRLIVSAEKQKVYGLNIYLTVEDYKATRKKYITGNYSEKKKAELIGIKKQIDNYSEKARDIISKMAVFTFEEFESRMFGNKNDTLFLALEYKIAEMMKQERVANASTYQCTLNTLKMFRGGNRQRDGRTCKIIGAEDLPLTSVNAKFLQNFEKWYLGQVRSNGKNYSITSVGIYVRNIRVILNDAVSDGRLSPEAIPIGKKKYRIPGSRKRKIALNIEDISKIMYAELLPGSEIERFRDYWIFSYLAGGMNFTDMARLRYENIDIEKITYIRHKTAYTKLEDPTLIVIPLIIEIAAIIDKWGNRPASPLSYVFPISKPDMTAIEQRKAIMACTRSTNHYIKKITKVLEIKDNISTYTARHSFCTILRNSGAPTAFISEVVGHSSESVTVDYFKDWEMKEKRKQWLNLIPEKDGEKEVENLPN